MSATAEQTAAATESLRTPQIADIDSDFVPMHGPSLLSAALVSFQRVVDVRRRVEKLDRDAAYFALRDAVDIAQVHLDLIAGIDRNNLSISKRLIDFANCPSNYSSAMELTAAFKQSLDA
ncbi:MAG: hypothetical protein QM775_16560 [Pirellulales bacterium]